MLISHRRQFIYTKTFKTAGTSVESYFEPWCMGDGEWTQLHERPQYESAHGVIGFRGIDPPPRLRWWNHMTAAEIRARAGDAVWNGYFKFCVIRNPYDRAVSAFYFDRSKGRVAPSDDDEGAQFERWLLEGHFRMDREQYVIGGRLAVDDVIRYERLALDLEAVCARLGLPWEPARLPTFKAGIRPVLDLESIYSERARAAVARQCAFEIERFGYVFPGLAVAT
jgi:hypothetical protein